MSLSDIKNIKLNMLYSDTTENFISPAEPKAGEEVKFIFRVAFGDKVSVYLVIDDERIKGKIEYSDKLFDYYVFSFKLNDQRADFYYEIAAGEEKVFFDARGVAEAPDSAYSFFLLPGFKTPKWAKGAVMYQIYVDRFCNGDPSNDVCTREYNYIDNYVTKIEDWNKYPAVDGTKEFYGGDLQGVINKLPYLKNLGIEVIYFNPLFVSPSNHKYDIQDYDYIDPHFGKIVKDGGDVLPEGEHQNHKASKYITRVSAKENLEASNALFAELVSKAHEMGIRVIIDGVFNHCGSFNKWMDAERIYEDEEGYEKGAYVAKESPYNSYFDFYKDAWPYNSEYAGWWDYKTLPKLNYEASEALEEYILNIGKKWVSEPYSVDGWRLDVAADLGHSPEYNHHFWKRFREEVKSANPDAIILAEHYGDTSFWLQGDEWDSVMNYDAFMEPITWFLTGMEKHSDSFNDGLLGNDIAFWENIYRCTANFSYPSMAVAMNELSNHDHSRFMSRTSHTVGRVGTHGSESANIGNSREVFMAGVLMQMTWPGAPTIYYGDEAGVCGFTDPDNRRTYPWGREDYELIAFHKDIISTRKRHPELRDGSIKRIDSDRNFLCYARFFRDKPGKSLIFVNISDEPIEREIDVKQIGILDDGVMDTLFMSNTRGYIVGGPKVQISDGTIKIKINAKECLILNHE